MVHTGTNEISSRLAQWVILVELIQDLNFRLRIQTEKFAIFDGFHDTCCKKLKY